MALLRFSKMIFAFRHRPEFAAIQIGSKQREIPFALCETIHDQAPFLAIVEFVDLRSFYA